MTMYWRLETVGLKRFWKLALVIAAVLVLVTVYLAIYFAPLPSTSVRTAWSTFPSVVGSKITVVGFVVWLESGGEFRLADFSDYGRYTEAVAGGDTSLDWATVVPIPVRVDRIYEDLFNGANVSVFASIVGLRLDGSPSYNFFYLQAERIEVGAAGEFGVMTAPIAQKIFYFHMPSAWASYLAFGVTLATSVVYLRTRDQKYDHWAHSSVEIGVLFATIAILTGPIWAKQEWGVYWRWDDTKLVTTFILWLVYIGYLSLRSAISEPAARSRISAVYGILGFITVPMSFLSARIAPLLSSSHPEVIASSSGSLSPEAGMTIGIAVVAFTFVFITMLIKRVEIAESEEEIEELKRKIGGEE